MIVVADTSPLNYLVQIECESVLTSLYGRVLVPPSVLAELTHPGAPLRVKVWSATLPEWITVSRPQSKLNGSLASLGPGERDAIQLAEERQADLLLIDERKGSLEARRRGLATTGTLGVLLASGAIGLIDTRSAFERLIAETNFRSTSPMRSAFLEAIRAARRHTSE